MCYNWINLQKPRTMKNRFFFSGITIAGFTLSFIAFVFALEAKAQKNIEIPQFAVDINNDGILDKLTNDTELVERVSAAGMAHVDLCADGGWVSVESGRLSFFEYESHVYEITNDGTLRLAENVIITRNQNQKNAEDVLIRCRTK